MPDKDTEVLFPVAGVNVATEFGRQPKQTTPEGVNVRAYEALTERGRGGSRAGLSKFLEDTVPAGSELIQHLTVVVDPQAPSLLSGATLPSDATPFADPLNPGTFVRLGGSGIQVNPHAPAQLPEIQYVQKKQYQNGVTNTDFAVSLDDQPGLNNLIVLIIRTEKTGLTVYAPLSVTNSNLNAYTQVGGPGYSTDVTGAFAGGAGTDETTSLSMWFKTAGSGAPDQNVRITPGAPGAVYEVCILEYSGANAANPETAQNKNNNAVAGTNWTPGAVVLNNTVGQLIVAATTIINCSGNQITGYTTRFGPGSGTVPTSTGANTFIVDKTGLSGVGPQTVNGTLSASRVYAAIAAAFTR